MKILIICGGRAFSRYSLVYAALGAEKSSVRFVIDGGAQGADSHAKNAAVIHELAHQTVNADWRAYGRGAGAIRNERMLEVARGLLASNPGDTIEVWAFRDDLFAPDPNTGGNGTLDMCARATSNGIRTLWFSKSLVAKILGWKDERVVIE